MKINFVTFASEGYRPTLERIHKEANAMNVFDNCFILTDKDFDTDYRKLFKEQKRATMIGYGFYCWKSWAIKTVMSSIKDGDILVYADAGCTFNIKGKKRLLEYMKMLDNKNIIAFNQRFIEEDYTKEDVFHFLDIPTTSVLRTSGQLFAAILIIKKNASSSHLIEKWFDICNYHLNIIDDSPSTSANVPSFVAPRYDQSVLSLLLKQYDSLMILDEKEVIPWMNHTNIQYPILAIRKKKYTFGKWIRTFPIRAINHISKKISGKELVKFQK